MDSESLAVAKANDVEFDPVIDSIIKELEVVLDLLKTAK